MALESELASAAEMETLRRQVKNLRQWVYCLIAGWIIFLVLDFGLSFSEPASTPEAVMERLEIAETRLELMDKRVIDGLSFDREAMSDLQQSIKAMAQSQAEGLTAAQVQAIVDLAIESMVDPTALRGR